MSNNEALHDLLVITDGPSLFRVPVESDGTGYKQVPCKVDFKDLAYRRVMRIANPGARGPAFAVLPNKPDPSTSQISCYLINSENIRASNPWTKEAWNAEPDPDTTPLQEPIRPAADGRLDFLVAGSSGNVFRIQFNDDDVPGTPVVDVLPLGDETEVYIQLRNGLVSGSAHCFSAGSVLPLVNIAAIEPLMEHA